MNDFDLMPTSAQDLLDQLSQMDIDFELYHHKPVHTVEESRDIDAEIPGHHTRNMFLRTKKKENYLVTLSHDTPIDLKKLSDVLGCGRFSFGSPDRLFEYLGVFPGSVTPLSLVNAAPETITVILEDKMMRADKIAVHPLRNDMTVTLKPSDLLTFLKSHHHEPSVIDLSPAS